MNNVLKPKKANRSAPVMLFRTK